MKQLFHTYFVQRLVNSEHKHFGGEQCYQEIPFEYHLVVCTSICLLYTYFIYRWKEHAIDSTRNVKYLSPNLIEKISIVLGVLSLGYTMYRKVVRREGLFLLNPCHVALIMQLILLIGDNSSLWMRRLHTVWTGWLFGPLGALLIPHLQGLSLFQIVVFFGEHLLILPIGPKLLNRRYGFPKPNFKNYAIAFGTITIYHLAVLVPVCRIFKVNINFVLCHSPAEPLFDSFGYNYLILQILNLKLIGFFLTWFCSKYVSWITPSSKDTSKQD